MNDMKERRIKQFHEHKLSLNVKDDGECQGIIMDKNGSYLVARDLE